MTCYTWPQEQNKEAYDALICWGGVEPTMTKQFLGFYFKKNVFIIGALNRFTLYVCVLLTCLLPYR
jgi:hypothetical protein